MENLKRFIPQRILSGLSEQSYDAYAMGKMRVDTLNATHGELTGYDCPKCLNRGFSAVLRNDGSYFIRDCTCKPIRRCIRHMEQSGLSKSIRELTFDAYTTESPWQENLKSAAMTYAKDPKGWFMIGGQSGCGKSHLCTAICRELLLREIPLMYMPWRDTVAKLKAMAFDHPDRQALLEQCKNAEFLYIDDLFKTGRSAEGSTFPTQADINLAFEILNHRYTNRLPTILSSEILPMDLTDIDEATGSRVIEMCGKNVFSVSPSRDKNYRIRNVVCL